VFFIAPLLLLLPRAAFKRRKITETQKPVCTLVYSFPLLSLSLSLAWMFITGPHSFFSPSPNQLLLVLSPDEDGLNDLERGLSFSCCLIFY
jgi:hypothetical protein